MQAFGRKIGWNILFVSMWLPELFHLLFYFIHYIYTLVLRFYWGGGLTTFKQTPATHPHPQGRNGEVPKILNQKYLKEKETWSANQNNFKESNATLVY